MRARSSLFPLFVLLAACSGDKEEADFDGDGVEAPADCNDNDASVKPGAVELCDGIDNDCDGEIDEQAGLAYYVDADNDGFGDGGVVQVVLCELESGYAEVDGDCDDTDASIHPDAVELCDDADRDCDGDPTRGANDTTDWYIDSDGDGFGNSEAYGGPGPVASCVSPGANYVANGDDCDDGEADANPLGTEVCNGIDDDCSGAVDDNASDGEQLYADLDGDGFGDAAASLMGCPGEGLVSDATDCDDTNDDVYPGAAEICNGGIDDDCDAGTDEDLVAGTVYYTDNDGDSYGDVTVTACEQPADTVTRGGDCNDNDVAFNPGAVEDCGIDDLDCDGDPVLGAADAVAYYRDDDGDGYGDPDSRTDSCTPVTDYVTVSGDCDDLLDTVNPGAPELCNGDIDDDCNAATTDDDSPDAPVWYFDVDGDGFAGAPSALTACEQPPYSFDLAEDCDDEEPTTYPGANDICDGGIDNDCDPATDEELVQRLYEDADYDGYGNNSVFELGCVPSGALTNATPIGDDCDDTDPGINPFVYPDCESDHCGTLTTSENWSASLLHTVSCDVNVQGANSPVLTVEPGATVVFDPGTKLSVGVGSPGSLVVDANNPVLFTSSQPYPANGDWEGVHIGPNNDGSYLRNLEIAYGGGGNFDSAGLLLDLADTDLEIDGLISRRNAGDGVHVAGGEPYIHDSMLIDNDGNGLYVEANQGLARQGPAPSFTGNTLTGNGDRAITIPGSHADEVGPSGVAGDNVLVDVANPNGIDDIELLTGTMRTTGTWLLHDIPYYVAPNQTISVEDGPEAILTVADGVTVYFDLDAALEIGDDAEGSLIIGTYPAVPAPGDEVSFLADPVLAPNNLNWDGLHIGPEGGGSLISGLIVEGGGGNKGNLWIENSDPSIANSAFRYSDNAGIYVDGTAAAPRITATDMENNDTYGLFVASNSGIAREDVGGASFENNSFIGNGTTSVAMPPNFVGQLDSTSVFADADPTKRVRIHEGTVTDNATWQKLDADYEALGDIFVEGTRDPELTVEPDVVFYMARDAVFEVGGDEDGALLIDAGPANPVWFTSVDPAPGPGDWVGVTIGDNGPLMQQSRLDGVVLEYAGSLGSATDGAFKLQTRDGGCPTYGAPQRNVELRNITVLESGNIGFHLRPAATMSLENVVVDAPLDGLCIVMIPQNSCPDPEITAITNLSCPGVDIGYIDPGSLDAIPPGDDLGVIALFGGALSDDLTLPGLASSYWIQNTFEVTNAANPRLTIEDGATLLFNPGAGIEVGTTQPGELVIEGTNSNFLPFDGNEWLGIELGSNCDADIQGGYFEAANGNGEGAIWVDGCQTGNIDAPVSFGGMATCDIAVQTPLDPGFVIAPFVPLTCELP